VSALRSSSVYQGALEASLAVAICVGFGVWADDYFDTSPGFLLAGLAIGFGAFITRLLRLTKEMSEAKNDAADNGKQKQGENGHEG